MRIQLELRIDSDLADRLTFPDGFAFLRLCGRSPKDGEVLSFAHREFTHLRNSAENVLFLQPLDRDSVRHRYQAELNKSQSSDSDGGLLTANDKLMALGRVGYLHVRSGAGLEPRLEVLVEVMDERTVVNGCRETVTRGQVCCFLVH